MSPDPVTSAKAQSLVGGTKPNPVLVAGHWRNNAELMADALRLHLPEPHSTVLDATWGKGNFWKPETLELYDVTSNDLHTDAQHHYDYREFPAEWGSRFDGVVLDEPYVVRGGRETDSSFREMNEAYGIHDAPTTPEGLEAMNHAGLTECARVCRQGGIVFVKYADAVSSGRRLWQIDGMKRHGESIGLALVDRMIFYTKTARAQPERTRKDGSESTQQHAHNNTSELLVFRTPGNRNDRTIAMF